MILGARSRIAAGILSALAVVALVVCPESFISGTHWAVRNWPYRGWEWRSVVGLVGVLVGVWLIGGIGYAGYRFLRESYRRRFQFSIRGLLLLTLMIALLLGTVGQRLQRYWAMDCVYAAGAAVDEYGSEDEHEHIGSARWFSSRLAFDPFGRVGEIVLWTDKALVALAANAKHFGGVRCVRLGAGITDAGLAKADGLANLPHLANVTLHSPSVTDLGLESMVRWSPAVSLSIDSCPLITNDGLAHLSRGKELKYLFLSCSGISDAGLIHLGKLSELQSLWLDGVVVTDAGLMRLRDIPRLKRLVIRNVPVTDAGIMHLAEMPQIEQIVFIRTKVTEDGVQRLRTALPQCQVAVMK